MAKQVGPIKITGCYDNICFYKMDGEYYARLKSSLTGKRVKKDPRFRRTMEYAGWLGQASKIASAVYRSLPPEKKEKGLYRMMTGQAMQWLKEGKPKEDILLLWQPATKDVVTHAATKKKRIEKQFPFADKILKQVFPVSRSSKETVIKVFFHSAPP